MVGDAEDKDRQGVATPISHFQKSGAAFSQMPDVDERFANDQRLFNAENPVVRDNVSDINRDGVASEQMYHNRSGGIKSIGDDHSRNKVGSQ